MSLFFKKILQQCIESGLVDGDVVHLDSSLIDGNVSKDTLQAKLTVISNDVCEKLDDCTPKSTKFKKTSPVDPDARLTRKCSKIVLGYKDHRCVDDKHGVITSTITIAANEADGDILKPLIEDHEINIGSKPLKSVADKAYGIGKNYRYLRENDIIPCINHKRKNCNCDPQFSNDKFMYNKKRNVFICPAGHELKQRQHHEKEGRTVYKASTEVCRNCPHVDKCVSSKKSGRQV